MVSEIAWEPLPRRSGAAATHADIALANQRAVSVATAYRRHSPGIPLQVFKPVLLECHSGAGDEILDRARYQHLARRCQRSNTRSGVHGDTRHLPVDEFALPGVQPGPHFDLELAHALDDGAHIESPAPDHRSWRRSHRRQCPSPGLGSARADCARAHDASRAAHAMHDRPARQHAHRANDVGEEHCREDALRFAFLPSTLLPDPGQELLDLPDDRLALSHPGKVVLTGEPDGGRQGSRLPLTGHL